jgi:hypothetical protein
MSNRPAVKTVTLVQEALIELMRDENAWTGEDWNGAWEKLKNDLYEKNLIR